MEMKTLELARLYLYASQTHESAAYFRLMNVARHLKWAHKRTQ